MIQKMRIPILNDSDFINMQNLNEDSWIILNAKEQSIKFRIEEP